MRTSAGERRLRFGNGFRVDANASLRALLRDLLGEGAAAADPKAAAPAA
jgi:hypothetical protein